MNQQEIRELIAKSSSPNWFKDIEFNYDIPFLDIHLQIKGFSSVFAFIKKQVDGWHKIDDELLDSFGNSAQHFQNLLNELENFISSMTHHNEAELNQR